MRKRDKMVRRQLRSKDTKRSRKRLIELANTKLFAQGDMEVDTESYNIGMDNRIQHKKMDVNDNNENAMDIDAYTTGKMCATRTKPVNSNKYAKRVGAKTAKK